MIPMPDQETIALVAEKLAPFHGSNQRLGVLLALCVGRLMLKAARRGEDWRGICRDEDIRHVADWLKAADVNDAEWLANVDEQGFPKKLRKFGTMEGLIKEVDNSMLIEAQKLRDVKLSAGDETFHAELADGMYLVRLETSAALDRESAEMQHCIGNGGYDDLLDDDDYLFLSLRDRNGKPHATLEIVDGAIEQIQGKQNKLPVQKYIDALVPFMKGYRLENYIPARYLGHVIDIHGRWHPLDNLPNGITVAGDLDITNTRITSLPERLTVRGNLYASRSDLTALPKGLRVTKGLFISNTRIRVLPDDLNLGGDLYVKNTEITDLLGVIGDTKRVVTSEGPMSAAKFRAAHSGNCPPPTFAAASMV